MACNTTVSAHIPYSFALIIDDHPLFCDALSLTLTRISGMSDVGVAHTFEEAMQRLALHPRPELVLLDLDLPDVGGLDGLIRLRSEYPDVPVLVVSSLSDQRVICSAMTAGAAGFVPKQAERECFRVALETIARGENWLPEGILLEDTCDHCDAVTKLAQLTRQQLKILELLCQGKLNKQIAWELSIAETTVKAHVTAIMRKLGVQSRTQAVLIAQQAKFTAFTADA